MISTTSPQPTAALKTYALAGLGVTLADATDGIVYFGATAGLNPIGVLQYIASGLLGNAAFANAFATTGLVNAAIGLAIHVFLSYGFTAVLFAALSASNALRRAWIPTGLVWGALVNLFMTFVALPHSNVAHASLTAVAFFHGIIGHALFVGLLPAFIIARKAA